MTLTGTCFQAFGIIFFITFYPAYIVDVVTSNISVISETDFPEDFNNMALYLIRYYE